MYGADHPAFRSALESCATSCQQVRGIRIGSRGIKHYCDNLCLSECPSLEAINARLTALRIASLTIEPHATSVDIQALITSWSQIAVGTHWTSENGEQLFAQTSGKIVAAETSYRGIQVTDGTVEGPGADVDWSAMNSEIARVANGSEGVTATELAAVVNSNLDAQILGLPPEVLESAANALAQAGPEARAAMEARLALFFNSLSSGVRDATTQIDIASPARSLKLLEQLSGTIPPAAVVRSVEHVEDARVLVSPDGVRLLARLVWLARNDGKLRDRLNQVIGDLHPENQPQAKNEQVASSVAKLQEFAAFKNISRDDYENFQSSIAKHTSDSPARSQKTLGGWTAQTAQIHAAGIAIDLALDPLTPLDNIESVFAHIEQNVTALLEAGEFELLASAASAIGSIRERDIPLAAAQAVERCETAICSVPIATRIGVLTHAGIADARNLAAIFARCGGGVVAGLIESILAGNIELDPTEIINHPALNMREFVAGLFKCKLQTLKTVAQLFNVTPDRRGRIAHAMLSHEDPELRTLAYRVFHELYPEWPASLVSHAFMEDDPQVFQLAFERLGRDPVNLSAAARFLSGRMKIQPDSKLFDSGIRALANLGAASTLSEIRSQLLKSPSPSHLLRATKTFGATRRAAKVHS